MSQVQEMDSLDGLIAKARQATSFAEQLAADAAELLRQSNGRLEDIEGKGFFKRLYATATGKTAAVARATQADLVRMQDLSWRYLEVVQEQNLVGLRALAVVRCNLARLATSDARALQLLEMVAGKLETLDARVSAIENTNAIRDWLHHLPTRGFGTMSPWLSTICLAVEYGELVGDDPATQQRLVHGKDLSAAILSAGLHPESRLDLEAFVDALIEIYLASGLEPLHASLGKTLPAGVGQGVSSVVTAVTYDLVAAISAFHGAAQRVADPAVRREMVASVVATGIGEIRGECSLLNFCVELAASVSLARSIRTGQAAPASAAKLAKPSVAALLSRHIPIKYHALADSEATGAARSLYLYSFGLVFSESLPIKAQVDYLASVAKPLGVKFDDDYFLGIARDPSTFPIDEFLGLLPDRRRQTAWLVDAAALVAMRGDILPAHAAVIQHVAVALDVPISHCEEVIPAAVTLASTTDRRDLLEAIRSLAPMSHAWRTVFDFRRLDLRGLFHDEREVIMQLQNKRQELASLLWPMLHNSGSYTIADLRDLLGPGLLKGAAIIGAGGMLGLGAAHLRNHEGTSRDSIPGSECAGVLRAIREHIEEHKGTIPPMVALARAFAPGLEEPSIEWLQLGLNATLQADASLLPSVQRQELAKIHCLLAKLDEFDCRLMEALAQVENATWTTDTVQG